MTTAASGELPPAGSCTCSQVRGLARRLTGIYDAALLPHGLTITQYAALMTLARVAGALAIGDLAQRLQMDRSTTSRLLAPLQRDGLVSQAAGVDRADHRARFVRLTARGERRLRAAVPAWSGAQQQVEALLGVPLARSLAGAARRATRALVAPQQSRRPPSVAAGARPHGEAHR